MDEASPVTSETSNAAGATRGGEAPRPAPLIPTRREAVRALAKELDGAGIESPELEAERLVCHALGLERHELAMSGAEPLRPGDTLPLARTARRRMAGEPLQHIEGTVAFRELVLVADSRALIPRPETEQLIDRIAAWAFGRRSRSENAGAAAGGIGVKRVRRPAHPAGPGGGQGPQRAAGASGPAPSRIRGALDIGTGSGAIALSLVVEGIAGRVVATDVSREALAQAEENRARVGDPGSRVELRAAGGSVWQAIGPEERFDLIVSNPPYVRTAELDELAAEVREFEPRAALAGGVDGLEIIREIVGGAAERLEPGGALFLEIGRSHGADVEALFATDGSWSRVEIGRDLAGRIRFVRAEVEAR